MGLINTLAQRQQHEKLSNERLAERIDMQITAKRCMKCGALDTFGRATCSTCGTGFNKPPFGLTKQKRPECVTTVFRRDGTGDPYLGAADMAKQIKAEFAAMNANMPKDAEGLFDAFDAMNANRPKEDRVLPIRYGGNVLLKCALVCRELGDSYKRQLCSKYAITAEALDNILMDSAKQQDPMCSHGAVSTENKAFIMASESFELQKGNRDSRASSVMLTALFISLIALFVAVWWRPFGHLGVLLKCLLSVVALVASFIVSAVAYVFAISRR